MIRLSKTRRKRAVPEDWATAEIIQTYVPIKKSEPLYSGSQSLSLDTSGDLALVGGADGVAGVFSISQNTVVQALKGGKGAVTDTLWVGSRAVIATSAGVVKAFENGSEISSFSSHSGEVTALAVHPSGEILASVGVDKSYVFYDLEASVPATQVFTDSGT